MLFSKNKPFSIIWVLLLVALGSSIATLQFFRLRAFESSAATNLPEQMGQESQALSLRLQMAQQVPSFGFDNLIADWYFLGFLQYFGDQEIRQETGYQVSPDFFRIILDRDPRFFLAYVFLSGSTTLYAAQPEVTVDLIEQGLAHLTPATPAEAPYIWRYKGVDELLFLNRPEQAVQSYNMAADWAEVSPYGYIQAMAESSRETAAFIAENPDTTRTLIMGWSQILGQAVDEYTFNLAVDQIEALGGSVVRTESGGVSVQIPENLDQQTP